MRVELAVRLEVLTITDLLCKLWRDDEGQDIAEYAVMLAVILVIACKNQIPLAFPCEPGR